MAALTQVVSRKTGEVVMTVIDLGEERYWGDCNMCGEYRRLDHAVAWYCGPTHDEIGSISTEYRGSDGKPAIVGGMCVQGVSRQALRGKAMKIRDGLSDPPPSGRLVLGIWQRGGLPVSVGLTVKGPRERTWHSSSAVTDGTTELNTLVFNPSHWIDLSEMPPYPDERSKFPQFTETKKTLVDFGWPLALPTGLEPVSPG